MRKITATLVSLAALAGFSLPAHADTYSVSVSKTTAISRAGETVSVTLNGIPAGEGVYVRYCATPASGVRPTQCDGQGMWATLDATWLAYGAVSAASPVSLPVKLTFTSGGATVDCASVGCGVFVRRDHLGSTDYTLDSFTPVTFEALPEPFAKVTANGSRVKIRVANFVGNQVRVRVGNHVYHRPVVDGAASFNVYRPENNFTVQVFDGSNRVKKTHLTGRY